MSAPISVKEQVDTIVYCTAKICPNAVDYEPDDSIAIFYPILYVYFTADYLFRVALALTRNTFIDMNMALTRAEAEVIVILSPILGLGGLTFATFGGLLFILGIIVVTTVLALAVAGSVLLALVLAEADEATFELFFVVLQAALDIAWRTFVDVDIPAAEAAVSTTAEDATKFA